MRAVVTRARRKRTLSRTRIGSIPVREGSRGAFGEALVGVTGGVARDAAQHEARAEVVDLDRPAAGDRIERLRIAPDAGEAAGAAGADEGADLRVALVEGEEGLRRRVVEGDARGGDRPVAEDEVEGAGGAGGGGLREGHGIRRVLAAVVEAER